MSNVGVLFWTEYMRVCGTPASHETLPGISPRLITLHLLVSFYFLVRNVVLNKGQFDAKQTPYGAESRDKYNWWIPCYYQWMTKD